MNQSTRPHTDIRSIYHLPGKTIQFQLDPVSFHAFLGTDTNVPTNQNQIWYGLFSDKFIFGCVTSSFLFEPVYHIQGIWLSTILLFLADMETLHILNVYIQICMNSADSQTLLFRPVKVCAFRVFSFLILSLNRI